MTIVNHVHAVPGLVDFDHILSPAVQLGNTLYLSGQTPRGRDGEVITGTIEDMTVQCIRNLEAVLIHAGGSLKDIVKVNIFLKDMDDFARVNDAYQAIMPTPKAARSCIQVARNPADVRIEIEAIARAPMPRLNIK